MGTLSRYRFVLFAVIVLVSLVLLLQACGRNDSPATATPRAGGVVVGDQAAIGPASGASFLPTPATVVPTAPTAVPVPFTVGQVITASTPVSIFATAASSSTVLEVYRDGATFTVLEPNEQYTAYPVSSGGAAWVRVRAGDGLAGWAKADGMAQ